MFEAAKGVPAGEMFLEWSKGITLNEGHFEVVYEEGLGVVWVAPLGNWARQACNLFLIYLRLVGNLTDAANKGRLWMIVRQLIFATFLYYLFYFFLASFDIDNFPRVQNRIQSQKVGRSFPSNKLINFLLVSSLSVYVRLWHRIARLIVPTDALAFALFAYKVHSLQQSEVVRRVAISATQFNLVATVRTLQFAVRSELTHTSFTESMATLLQNFWQPFRSIVFFKAQFTVHLNMVSYFVLVFLTRLYTTTFKMFDIMIIDIFYTR